MQSEAMLRSGAVTQPSVAMLRSGAGDLCLEATHTRSFGSFWPGGAGHGRVESSPRRGLAPLAATSSARPHARNVPRGDPGARLRADQSGHQPRSRHQSPRGHRADRPGPQHRRRNRQRGRGALAGQQPAARPQHVDVENRSDLRCRSGRCVRRGAGGTRVRPVDQLPAALREFVKAGQVAYQYATVHTDGFSGPALVIGTPTSSRVTNLELYLIFPLGNEQSTIALVRGTMATGGLVLMVLLAGIAWLVTRQVVVPVRAAARTAERFAEGHLSERMPIRGEDDMARLAVSFNDMAESLSRQIAQLEEFGNLQRRFTSDVSHELRTPLTTVRMAADLIYDHIDDLEPALRRSTELMVNELDRFETLLSDL